MTSISFARHQFPPDVIRHAVWLYLRFTLSLRDVEEMLAEHGLDLTYETVRRWARKFGPLFARELRKRRQRPTGRWHLDEMVVKVAGKRHWLWRAVDDEGEVLDILVQSRRDTRAAVRLMRKLIKKQGGAGQGPRQAKLGGVDSVGFAPEALVTDSWAHSEPPSGSSVFWPATSRPGQEQPGRELASANTQARAQDAALQVARIGPAFFVRPCCRPQHLQHPAPPRFSRRTLRQFRAVATSAWEVATAA